MRIDDHTTLRALLVALAVAALLAPGVVEARREQKPASPPAPTPIERTGSYRLDAGPDVAGALAITADHRFEYRLSAGALDEEASGTWEFIGANTCLTTVPAPRPPAWVAKPTVEGPTVRVVWPDGSGIAGIGVRVGLDDGEKLDEASLAGGYTLEDGWALDPHEKRAPRWVELIEPVHGLASPRFPFNGARRLVVTLVPNDLGKVALDKACLEAEGTALVLRRGEGVMKFYRFDR